MRDQLVRYLLGELNLQEQEQLEAQLRDSPDLRRELEYLRSCMSGSGAGDECDFEQPAASESPRGLAERTLGQICGDEPCAKRERSAAEISAAYDPPAGSPSWSLADLTVAGGVFLAISLLFLPALRQSRDAARRTDCANNLRQLGFMMTSFADRHGGVFPTALEHQNAGIFTVYLVESGEAEPDELARVLICRSSPLADDIARGRVYIRVPSMAEFEESVAKQRCLMKRLMSGSYAGPMGYIEGERYFPIRNEHSRQKAIVADAPSQQLGNQMSANHGGCSQNVLYQDGHVGYQKKCSLPEDQRDAIYLNNAGLEAAGLDRDDTVLGRSEATPGGPSVQSLP